MALKVTFWPRAKLKGPKRSFVALGLVGGESFWNEQKMFAMEQKMFAMEQKMFLEQNYGIEMQYVAECGRL